jgi:hypothetical protein
MLDAFTHLHCHDRKITLENTNIESPFEKETPFFCVAAHFLSLSG